MQEEADFSFLTGRSAIFIDGRNLLATCRRAHISIDYRRLLALFRQHTHVVSAKFYTALEAVEPAQGRKRARSQDGGLQSLLSFLEYNGYKVLKRQQTHYPDTGKTKGDVDVKLATDMLLSAFHQRLDHIVLFSGDGDFIEPVEAVQSLGVQVTVVSSTQDQYNMVNDQLRRAADHFMEFTHLFPHGIISRVDMRDVDKLHWVNPADPNHNPATEV